MCCSIIGYCNGSGSDAAPILVQGLKRMEYRGYDSVGVATFLRKPKGAGEARSSASQDAPKGGGVIVVRKGAGKVSDVNASASLDSMPGLVGIGHTRWATHGGVTDSNAHPHPSSSGGVAIVHNGIIKNFGDIKSELVRDGYAFSSETDSEVIANLLQKNYDLTRDVKESMVRTVGRLQGEYAFVAMFEGGRLAAARLHEPLILGVGDQGLFLSSDVLGFIEYTDEAVYVGNGNMVVINDDMATFEMLDFEGNPTRYQTTKVSKEFGDAYKGDYAHFTLKEIYEQNETAVKAGVSTRPEISKAADIIRCAHKTYLTGSGSSYNAALVAKHFFARQAKIGTEAVIASEMRFAADGIEAGSVLVAISQSGESADVLNAVRIAREAGCSIVISVVNVMTSSLVHESDICIGMNCGPEIGVAATKSFTSQLIVFYRIISEIISRSEEARQASGAGEGSGGGGRLNSDGDARSISETMGRILQDPSHIQKVAAELRDVSDIYVLGRGVHHSIAAEAALKIKELTYIHAEGIAGGELKHGPLALMDSGTYVIILNPYDSTHDDTLTSASEIKARGARIIGISDTESDVYDHWIWIPRPEPGSNGIRSPIYAVSEIVPIQLLAYYVALERGTDPDYPRNLAKSVTVK